MKKLFRSKSKKEIAISVQEEQLQDQGYSISTSPTYTSITLMKIKEDHFQPSFEVEEETKSSEQISPLQSQKE